MIFQASLVSSFPHLWSRMKRLGVLACLLGGLAAIEIRSPPRYLMSSFKERYDIFAGTFPVYLYPLPIPKEEQSLQALAKSIYARLVAMGALRETPEVVEYWPVLYEIVKDFQKSWPETPVFKHDDTLFGIASTNQVRSSVAPFVFTCVSKLLGEEVSLTVDTAYVSDPGRIFEHLEENQVYSEPLPVLGGVWQAIPDVCAIDGFEPNLPITLFEQDGFHFGVLNIYPEASAFRTPGFSRLYNLPQRRCSEWSFDKPLKFGDIYRPTVVRSDHDWGFEFSELHFVTAAPKVFVLESQPMIARISPFLKGVTVPRAAFENLSVVLEGYSSFVMVRHGDQLRCGKAERALAPRLELHIVFPGQSTLIEIEIEFLMDEGPGGACILLISPSDTIPDNEVIFGAELWRERSVEFSSKGISFRLHWTIRPGSRILLSNPEIQEKPEPETADSGWIVAAISGAVSLLIAGGTLMWLRNRELDPRLIN